MTCPKCGGKTRVRDVVQDSTDHKTYRQRTCSSCGRVFYTAEIETENNSSFNKKWFFHHRAYSSAPDDEAGVD